MLNEQWRPSSIASKYHSIRRKTTNQQNACMNNIMTFNDQNAGCHLFHFDNCQTASNIPSYPICRKTWIPRRLHSFVFLCFVGTDAIKYIH